MDVSTHSYLSLQSACMYTINITHCGNSSVTVQDIREKQLDIVDVPHENHILFRRIVNSIDIYVVPFIITFGIIGEYMSGVSPTPI